MGLQWLETSRSKSKKLMKRITQEVGDFQIGTALSQFLDRITSVPEDSFIAVDITNRRPNRCCVQIPWVVQLQPLVIPSRRYLQNSRSQFSIPHKTPKIPKKNFFKETEKSDKFGWVCVYKYLFEIGGFDGAFVGDLDLVLPTSPLVNDGQGAVKVRRRRYEGLSWDAVWLESGGAKELGLLERRAG